MMLDKIEWFGQVWLLDGRVFYVFAAAVLGVVFVVSVTEAIAEMRASHARGRWTAEQWAEQRTGLLDSLYQLAGGQLLDVRRDQLVKHSNLGRHFKYVEATAIRHQFMESEVKRVGGWRGIVREFFPDNRIDEFVCYSFTNAGLIAYEAAKAQGMLVGRDVGTGVIRIDGEVRQLQLNMPGATGTQGGWE